MIAKFKVHNIEKYSGHWTIEMYAIIDKSNASWARGTPWGTLKLSISNPNVYEQFEVGKVFLLPFTPVNE